MSNKPDAFDKFVIVFFLLALSPLIEGLMAVVLLGVIWLFTDGSWVLVVLFLVAVVVRKVLRSFRGRGRD